MSGAARTVALLALSATVMLAAVACAGSGSGVAVPGGDASRGAALVRAFGCGACHTISGVAGADGQVGPSLDGLSRRRVIAGRLANTPANLVRWIQAPQAVDPGNVMPDLGVGPQVARDIAAYLDR